MAESKLKVAALSANGMNRVFAEAFRKNPKVEIVAVTEDETPPATARTSPDETQQGNKDAAQEYGVPFFERLDDVLERPDVDAVTLTSPFERRAALVEKIASAGKHIFIDKPMTNTLADNDAIIESVKRNGVKLTVGHAFRFDPAILEAREALRAGHVGLPWAIHSEWIVAGGAQAAPIGEFMNHSMFPLDAMLYLVPSRPQTVYCIAGSYFFENAKANNLEDLGFITMNLEQGIIATTSIGRTPVQHVNGTGGDMTIRVMGTHGMVYVDTNRPKWVSYGKSGVKAIKYGADRYYDLTDHFVDSILNDREPMCNAQDARNTLEVTLAALQSAKENRVVKLPLPV